MKTYSFAKNGVLALLITVFLFVSSCKKAPSEPNKPAAPVSPPKQQPADANSKAKAAEPSESQAVSPKTETTEAASSVPAGWVPLKINLPKPMFVGTPSSFQNVTNLEKPRPAGVARAPFYAPADITNVAVKKPVSSSEKEPIIGELDMVTDGDKEATDGSYVELGPGKQYVAIDLEEEYEIYAVCVWHYHSQARVFFDVIVQTADDPDFITNVQTIFNNDNDNSCGQGIGKNMSYVETNEGKLIDAKGVKGRYVRLYSKGNNADDFNYYTEVEVYAKPAK